MIICAGSQSCVKHEEENAGGGVGWLAQTPGVTVGELAVRDGNNLSIIDTCKIDSPGVAWTMGSSPPLLPADVQHDFHSLFSFQVPN